MNIKKSLIVALASVFSFTAMAQEEKYEYEFQPYWYGQVQVGGQHTLGEIDFGKLLSPNAQIAVGYQFDRIFGARLSVNAWQSKAGSEFNVNNIHENLKWKWNYIAPTLDFTMNISDALYGFNPNRVFNFGIFAGIGANIAFKNDEATDVFNYMSAKYPEMVGEDVFLRYHWTGTKARMTLRAGVSADFKVSDKVKIGLEVNANTLSDRYNSKKAGGSTYDWYFNGLVGIKYNFGPTHTKKKVETHVCPECPPCPEPRVVEKIVEKVVEKAPEVEPLRETIFYAIRVSDPDAKDIINKVVAWCEKYPTHGISVRGYADKGTGNPKINQGYAQKRAQKIADVLKSRGIDSTRISVSAYGDTVQPFAENDKNRCVIIVGE